MGPDGKDLECRDEKCELYSREMKFFKLRRDKYTVWKDLKVRAGRTPRDGPFLPSFWVLLKDSVHQTNCILN